MAKVGVKSPPQGQGTVDIYVAFLRAGGGLIFPFINSTIYCGLGLWLLL